MPRFVIHHVTKYTYPEAVRDSANQIMLYPVKDKYQLVQNQQISITGEPVLKIYKDYYGNEVGSFTNVAPHIELRIDSTISVTTIPIMWPTDEVSTIQQWAHLQEIKFVIPFIDFLKQENFSALPE